MARDRDDRRRDDDHFSQIDDRMEQFDKLLQRMDQRYSLKKNGDSWRQYLGKVITIDRVLLFLMLIYQAGGQVQNYKLQLDGLVTREQAVVQQQGQLTQQLDAASRMLDEQGGIVKDLMSETERLKTTSSSLTDRIGRTITRAEFEATVQQRIIPRLERIEQTLKVQ